MRRALKTISRGLQEAKELLKLICCEFLKLRRKGAYKLALFTTVLFPLFNAALLSDGDLEDIMSGVREESGFLLLIPVLVIMAASLFFEEHDNDTLKNLLCVPVSKQRLVATKLLLLFLFSILYELAGFAISILLAATQGITISGWCLQLLLTLCTGMLLWAAALPCIILVIWCNKSYIISVIIAFFYTLLGYALHLSDAIMMKPLGPNFTTFIPVPMIFRWLYQFKVPEGKIMTDFYNRLSPYFVSTPAIFMILITEAVICTLIVMKIYQKQET